MTPRSWTVVVLLTVLVAAVLRLAGLQSGLWYDEIVTLVGSVRHPLRQIVTEYPGVNTHPLYSVVARVSVDAFGESAWAIRLPAAAFGILSVAMVYMVGARIMTRAEAWAGAAVLATSYHHVWFSQNARGYTLLGLLTLWSTGALLRALSTDGRRFYVIYAVTAAAGMYAHLTMGLVIIGQAAAVALGLLTGSKDVPRARVRLLVWAWVGAGVLAVATYAPFIPGLTQALREPSAQQTARLATTGWAAAELVRSVWTDGGVVPALAGILAAGIGGASLLGTSPFVFGVLTLPAVTTLLGIVALGQPIRPRFLFFLSGAAAMFVGRGIGVAAGISPARSPDISSRSMTVTIALTLGLVAASALALPQNYRIPKQDFDNAVAFADREQSQGARILTAGPACLPLHLYFGRQSWPCLSTLDDWRRETAGPSRAVVVYTLPDYIGDAALQRRIAEACRPVARFVGTLGDGDLVVCEAGSGATR